MPRTFENLCTSVYKQAHRDFYWGLLEVVGELLGEKFTTEVEGEGDAIVSHTDALIAARAA